LIFYHHPHKLFSLLLLNSLLIGALSPSWATEIATKSEAQPSTRKVSNREEHSAAAIQANERIGDTALLTRSEFLESAEPFFEQIRLHFATEFSILSSSTRLHTNSVVYLADQTNRLTREAEQLLAEMPQVAAARPTSPLPHTQQKAAALNGELGVATAKQKNTPEEAVQSALAELRDALGVDLSAADGTFAPEQTLTRGEYFRYLQQIDQGLVELQYGNNIGVVSVLSINPMQAAREFDAMNSQLRAILRDIAEVQFLTNQLRQLLSNKDSHTRQVKPGLSHFTNKPVKNNGLLSQANATETIVTHGDFALYVISQITEVLSSNNSFVEQEKLYFTTAHYASISEQLAGLSSELEGAIAQLNSSNSD